MSASFTSLLSDVPRLTGLAIALLAALVALGAYWRRERPSAYAGLRRSAVAVPRAASGRYSPTVKAPDSQRVDRLRRICRLAPGEHADILENHATHGGAVPRFRISLKSVLRLEDGSVAARIGVDFGGTAVSCGPLVEEITFNEFVLPRATRDEPRNCVFHYQHSGDSFAFRRIKRRGLAMDADVAEIDVLQMSEHWPAA